MGIQDQILEIRDNGYCVIRKLFDPLLVEACRAAFWPTLLAYLDTHGDKSNRGPPRHFIPMPFEPPCFAPEFFFNHAVLSIVRCVMDDRYVRRWYADDSRDVSHIPRAVWESMTSEQRVVMRFPVGGQ